MKDYSMLYPVLALAWWTLTVLLLIPYRRLGAVKQRTLSPEDFTLGESARVSEYVALPNRNYMNLLEAPVIFYLLCLIAYFTHNASMMALALAWIYVGLRVIHSVIHVTYNKVQHRLYTFAASNLVLLLLLLNLTLAITGNQSLSPQGL